ncbi:MAG: hypothetical protein MK209_02780 [Planctomycetes bacterium]|nr:hypothetical protein [Planctomycetota bacterium]
MQKLSRHSSVAHGTRAGLGRAETLWLIVLAAGVIFSILGSLNADRDGRDLREARDELSYLAGQISFALRQDANQGKNWPEALVSTGSVPNSWQGTPSLATVLGESTFLPSNPEGYAYHLQRHGPRAWVLSAALADGSALDLSDREALAEARQNKLALDLRLP